MLRLRKTNLLTLRGTQSLNFKSHNNFNDLLKQPIYSFTQNSFINFDLEAIKQLQANFGLDWTTSIILASGGLRLFLTGSNYLISKLNLKHPEERKTWKEFQEKVFFKDLEKTEKFIDSEVSSIEQKKRWYSLNNLVSVGWSGFILVNWFRSLHFLCFNTHFFQNLSTEHILGVFPLVSYDPYFIMPVITFLFNYFAISGSKHPFLSIFNQEQNLIRRFNKIFLLSLPAIFFPSAYLISWCSFLATHMALRKLQQVAHDRKQNATLNKYVLTPKKISQIEEYYNRVVLKGKSKND